jgi:hypothetical protein
MTVPGVPVDERDFDQLVNRFLANAEEYEKTFRNLVAEETKVLEVYRASGQVQKRRQIVSDLVVYHSSRDGRDATTEYRDVRSVDGRPIERRSERALQLLTSAAKAESIEKELESIDRETSRHEFNRHLRGTTVRQGGVLRQWRDAFRVERAGREQIAGRDVVVLDYRQTRPIPGFALPVPREFGNPPPIHRGRIWLDAQTGQLWRHVWELAWPHPASSVPLVMLRQESAYGPSRFGILVPERIVWDWLTHFDHPRNGRPSFALSERATFTYGSFRRFEVVTDEQLKDTEDAQPF